MSGSGARAGTRSRSRRVSNRKTMKPDRQHVCARAFVRHDSGRSRMRQPEFRVNPGSPGKAGNRRTGSAKSRSNGTNQKNRFKSISYRKVSITVTCYLCNTRPKTRQMGRFGVVPLLRVQSRSVIVVARRRGASRSRPVSIGRLSPSRSCGCVRRRDAISDGLIGTREPTPRVSHPADPEPTLTEQLGGLT